MYLSVFLVAITVSFLTAEGLLTQWALDVEKEAFLESVTSPKGGISPLENATIQWEVPTQSLKGSTPSNLSQFNEVLFGGLVSYHPAENTLYLIANDFYRQEYTLTKHLFSLNKVKKYSLNYPSKFLHTYSNYSLIVQNTSLSPVLIHDQLVLMSFPDGKQDTVFQTDSEIYSMVSDGTMAYLSTYKGIYEVNLRTANSELLYSPGKIEKIVLKNYETNQLYFSQGTQLFSYNISESKVTPHTKIAGGQPHPMIMSQDSLYFTSDEQLVPSVSIQTNETTTRCETEVHHLGIDLEQRYYYTHKNVLFQLLSDCTSQRVYTASKPILQVYFVPQRLVLLMDGEEWVLLDFIQKNKTENRE